MSWDIELAKELKNRNNKKQLGPQIGEVISINPLRVTILNNRAILDNSNSYICSKLIIEIGDSVLCIPTADEQKFFIVDKVVM